MSDPPELRGSHLPGGLARAREALLRWIDEAGEAGRRFLEVHLLRTGPDRYRVRHAADATVPVSDLVGYTDPFAAREIAQITAAGEHRPLKTAPNLRRGWSFDALDGSGVWIVLDYLYPACAAHWYAGREGTLRVTHWKETAARQSGMYSAVGLLEEPALRNAVRACCGHAVCLRQVAWGVDSERSAPLETDLESRLGVARVVESEAVVLCPEACSLFISFARKVLTLERAPRQELPGLGALGTTEVEQLRQIVDSAAAGGPDDAREGDFDSPINQRRIRYLAAKLQF